MEIKIHKSIRFDTAKKLNRYLKVDTAPILNNIKKNFKNVFIDITK
jgi:hypothetical protein